MINLKGEALETNKDYIELYKNIHIYTGLLPDVSDLYEIIKKSEASSDGKFYLDKWTKWARFGTYSQEKHPDDALGSEKENMYDKEKYLSDRVYEAYNTAIEDYIEKTGMIFPEGAKLNSSSFSKYNFVEGNSDKDMMAMNYHIDQTVYKTEEPGRKFLLTCTTYINDDYEGGALEFYIPETGEVIYHKPKAGEIFVFPSTNPYYHGVTAVRKSDKFLIRNFITYEDEGADGWKKEREKYTEDQWNQIKELENKNNTFYRVGDKIVGFDEYQSFRESQGK